jgi:hypothetical protein
MRRLISEILLIGNNEKTGSASGRQTSSSAPSWLWYPTGLLTHILNPRIIIDGSVAVVYV